MKIAVLGAGTMGHGIAQITAMVEHDVVLRDVAESYVNDGLAAIRENLEKGVEYDKVDPETVVFWGVYPFRLGTGKLSAGSTARRRRWTTELNSFAAVSVPLRSTRSHVDS